MSSNASLRLFIWTFIILMFSACPKATKSTDSSYHKLNAEEQLRLELVHFAKNYLGSNYKYAGKKPASGFDCSGFTYYVFNNFNIELSPSSALQAKQGKKIKEKEVKAGDLVFYQRKKGGRIFHVSIVTKVENDEVFVIHSTSRGVVIDNITQSSYWAPKIAFYRRVIELKIP